MLTVRCKDVTICLDDSYFASTPYVYKPALRGKLYEQAMLEHIAGLGIRGLYVDVGAHLGTHTLFFAMCCPSTRVYALEPVARIADVLERNVEANGLGRKVRVRRVGAGTTRMTMSATLCAEHQEGFPGVPQGPVDVTFPVVPLDEVIPWRKRVAVLKLDIEGQEPMALIGAERILRRDRPVIFAEARTDAEYEMVLAAVAPHGYAGSGRWWNASPTWEFTHRG